jgi:hypothetical protein
MCLYVVIVEEVDDNVCVSCWVWMSYRYGAVLFPFLLVTQTWNVLFPLIPFTMLPEASQKELDALNKEFKYGIRGDILPIHPPKSNAESVYFQLTTHEGLLVHVELSNGGFRVRTGAG